MRASPATAVNRSGAVESLRRALRAGDSPVPRRLENGARVCTIVVTLIGAGVLAGWSFGIGVLKTALPGLASMKPTTALCFILAGAAVAARRRAAARRICAGIVLALAAATLMEDLAGIDFGVDQLAFRESPGGAPSGSSGRMSFVTAVNFIFIGIALLLLGTRRAAMRRTAEALALFAGATALISLLGYAYGADLLYQLPGFGSIALHTAFAFVACSAAILCAQPDGIASVFASPGLGGQIARRFLLLAVLTPALLGWFVVLASDAGMLSEPVRIALFAGLIILALSALVWRNALWLDLADAGRNEAQLRDKHRTHLLEMLATGAPLPAILDEIVRFVERDDPTSLCSILLLDRSGKRLLHGAGPSLPDFYNQAVNGLCIGSGVGSCGTAAFTGERVIVSDVTVHPFWEGFRALAAQANLRSCWSQPVISSDRKVLGTFAIYHREPRTPEPRDIEIIETEAGYVSLVVERRRADEEVRKLNAELEQRVRERTAELEQANRELGSFSYSISHDLRAPLRAINGYSRILLEDYGSKLDGEGCRVATVITHEAQRMGQLIDALLKFSRLGRAAIAATEIDMTALARESFAEAASEAAARTVEFRLGELPPAWGDSTLLRQVWVNLFSNAVKFTREREPAVIEVGASSSDGETVYWVRDNGVGFDPRYADKLFGVFQRLHTAAEFEGTGVGLAVVQRIVQRHGGRIWAEAAPGEGAKFFFALPKHWHRGESSA
jgi:signal transduction histidine kinase